MLVLAAVAGMANAAQAQGIEINATNFPDPNFRAYVSDATIDKNTDGKLNEDEITAVTIINVTGENIAELKGIEHFTALTELRCGINQLTSLDLSANTALTRLDCGLNQLTSLDLSNCTALTYMNCESNQLSSLDVSKNTALTWLDCYRNQLSSLDVSANTALMELECDYNQLTTLDVSANTALTNLNCGRNQLTTLDVSTNTSLEFLHCDNNQLSTFDVSKNTALTVLYCNSNQLSMLDVSANTALTNLNCGSNQLTTLDLSKNTALTSLECYRNQLTSLDLSKNTALRQLICSSNQLTTLDVSKNTALTWLDCGLNPLTTLDVSTNTSLEFLHCDNNQLTALDVSANIALINLDCSYNQLTTLDVSANTALTILNCYNNQLTTLDVSANTALTFLNCYGNQIQGNEMLALVNSLPTVTSGKLYVVDTQNSSEGNVITKSQVAIATGKNWMVYAGPYYFYKAVEYAGVEEYVLTLGNPTNGTLSATPNGNVGVGTEVTLTATPDEGYKIKTLRAYKTDDESQEVTISENKFTMPAYAVTVEAEFEILIYTLTYTAGENGNIQGQLTQTVQHGGSGEEVEAVPNGIYKFYRWSDGLSTAKRTDSNVKANLSVTAEFIDASISIYSLTYTAGDGGRIKGTATQNVADGQSSIEVEAVPNEGYKFVKWSDGNTNAKRTESNVTANISVTAEFEVIIYTLTYTAGENGSIQGQPTQTVQHGQSGEEVVAVPNDGYRFVKWSDGVATAKRTDSNVKADLSVKAEFEKNAATGLFNVKQESLSVFPNPTQGVLWVSVPELAEGTAAEMHVYNTSGQLLQRVPAHGASTGSAASRLSIDLNGYPAGVYIIRVGNAAAKVVKQ